MSLLTIKLSSDTKTIEPKTTAPSAPYLAQKTSDGTLYYPLETYTSGEGLLIKGNGITYKVQEVNIPDVPNADDPYVQVSNILDFISGYTTGQMCFQGDGNGKFYVKAGSFTYGVNPELPSNGGVLIYDGVTNAGTGLDNYICAAHLANVMNYILYQTKDSDYGSATPLFTDTPDHLGSNCYTEKNKSVVPNGFYRALGTGRPASFYCNAWGITDMYNGDGVHSGIDNAVWW